MSYFSSPQIIQQLKQNQIFVFGTNTKGFHAKDYAKQAVKQFGAAIGRIGRWKNTYAIPMKNDYVISLPINEIKKHIKRFIIHTQLTQNLNNIFLVTQMGLGGKANYTVNDIAPLFIQCLNFKNIRLPQPFLQVIYKIPIIPKQFKNNKGKKIIKPKKIKDKVYDQLTPKGIRLLRTSIQISNKNNKE